MSGRAHLMDRLFTGQDCGFYRFSVIVILVWRGSLDEVLCRSYSPRKPRSTEQKARSCFRRLGHDLYPTKVTAKCSFHISFHSNLPSVILSNVLFLLSSTLLSCLFCSLLLKSFWLLLFLSSFLYYLKMVLLLIFDMRFASNLVSSYSFWVEIGFFQIVTVRKRLNQSLVFNVRSWRNVIGQTTD